MMVRLLSRQSTAIAVATGGCAFSKNFPPPAMVAHAFPPACFISPHAPKAPSSFSTSLQTSLKSSSSDLASRGDNEQKKKNGKKNKRSAGDGKGAAANNLLFRADKVLSHRASMSRSQAFDALMRRRVARRDESHASALIPIKGPKEKIAMDAIIYMDGKEIPQLPPVLIAYHKPKFMLSAMDEKHSDKTHLGMVLPDHYKKLKMHPVGRLDYDSSGLLLFSMEGDLTQRLLHPRYKVEKEYVATVMGGKVDGDLLKRQLEVDGVSTSEGIHFAKLLDVHELDLEKSKKIWNEYVKSQESWLLEESDTPRHIDMNQPLTDIRLVVQEGKYRMVRRMLANCNHPVAELKRERHGNVFLGDLPEGEFRECTADEIQWAKSLLRTTSTK